MNFEQLLREFEQLTYQGRMHRMVEVGRLAAHDSSAGETLAALAQGDMYQRLLATQACYGSHDTAHIVRALSDPSRSIRLRALRLSALMLDDEALPALLASLPLALKKALLSELHHRRRYVPIDNYLELLAARGAAELAAWLPFGSHALLERYLERISERLDLVVLVRIARYHPDLLITQLSERALAMESLDPQLIMQVNAVLPYLIKALPDQTLDLLRKLLVMVPLSRFNVQALVQRRPNEMVDLLVQANEQSSLSFDQVAARLDSEHVLTLFTRYPENIDTDCLKRLKPQQRFALYQACERGWRDSEGVLDHTIVMQLSAEQRLLEGRRHLDLPVLLTRPQVRLPYAAFLPWDEARALLDVPLRSPDSDLRGVALQALIVATRYQREHLVDILQLVLQRRNEQDPVRLEIFSALAELPPGIWRLQHLDNLAQAIGDALNASDLSYATAMAIERLIIYLFPFHPQWSILRIAEIYSKRGSLSFFHLERYLSDADVQRMIPTLMPILLSWQRRENEVLLWALADALGKHMRVFTQLTDLLEIVLQETLNSSVADGIVAILLKYQRERASETVLKLLQRDKSTILLAHVRDYLHRQRQDLLTPFLGQRAYRGRFSTGKTRIVLPFHAGFLRWTPAQQTLFAATLLEIVNEKDQHRATHELLSAIEQLAAMPAIDPAALITLASDERQPVRENALRALGRLDAGQGIQTLLDALNDERARIAIYALRRALLSMPQLEALNFLRHVPMTRITVAKEVVRLIGDLASEEAYCELLKLEASELHRDVRVALFRALWSYPAHQETWGIFKRAAQASDTALARGVVHIPADGLSSGALSQLVTVTDILLSHPEPEVRHDILQWRHEHPLADPEQHLFARLLALMNSPLPDECLLAAKAIFAIYTGTAAPLVGEAIGVLLSHRQALQIALDEFTATLPWHRRLILPTTRAILSVLATDPLTLSLRIDLIIQGLPWEEIAPELIKLSDQLHANALVRAQELIKSAYIYPDAQLYELESALMSSQNAGLRSLALAALLAQSRLPAGWSDACIARLQAYQNDPAPIVAETAQFTFSA